VNIPKDSFVGLLLLALAAGYYWLTRDIPASSLSDEVGADGLPKVLAVALASISLLIFGKGLIAARSSKTIAVKAVVGEDENEHASFTRAIGFVMIGVGYMLLAPLLGFAVGIAGLIVAVAVYERQSLTPKLFAVAAAGGFGFWLVFVRFLGAEQPASALLALFVKS
jgi:putative tricarboxylic transport membrane protein